MKATWGLRRLGSLVQTQKGYAFKSSWFLPFGRPIIKVSDFTNDSVNLSNVVFVAEHVASEYLKYELKLGDVVLQTVGSWPSNPASVVGKCVRIPRDASGALLNQNAVKLKPSEDLDSQFLFYLLRGEDFKSYIIGTAQGAASQAAITLDAIRAYEFALPSLSVQRQIGHILSTYDELIESSQQRIGILETIARALYRESLQGAGTVVSTKRLLACDFWSLISANISPYEGTKRYYATADIEDLKITGPGIDYTFLGRPSRAQKQPTQYSVWFARMKQTYKIASFNAVNSQTAASSILSSGFVGFQAKEPSFFALLFLTLSSQEFHLQKDLFCTGATQMSLTNDGLARIVMPIPDERGARRLGQQVMPVIDQMFTLQLKIENLRRTRDLLLPRLLSGQIDVPDI